MEPRFWLNLQTEYDVRIANRTVREKIAPRIRVFQGLGIDKGMQNGFQCVNSVQ